jgi:hypothetical protein
MRKENEEEEEEEEEEATHTLKRRTNRLATEIEMLKVVFCILYLVCRNDRLFSVCKAKI